MKKTDHHVIPCALDGLDIDFNIIRLSVKDHRLVHKVLNLDYWKIRKFRFANALCFRKDRKYFDRLAVILKKYFSNLNNLPSELIMLQKQAIAETIMYLSCNRFGYHVTKKDEIDTLVDAYCDVLLLISLSREKL